MGCREKGIVVGKGDARRMLGVVRISGCLREL